MKLLFVLIGLVVLIAASAWLHSALYTRKIERAHPPSGTFIDVAGHRQHAVQQGETGNIVLFLHGASANSHEFSWTLMPKLAGDHRLINLDRPGHGYSQRPRHAHKLAVQAQMVAGILKQLAPNEKAILVGHSFGGAVALRTALDHSEQIAGLVLLAPVTHDWGGGGEAWYNRYAKNPFIGPLFNRLPSIIGPTAVNNSIENVFSPALAAKDYFDKSAIGLLFRPAAFRANAEDVSALRAELAAQQARYTELTLPVTVYSGAGDTVLSPHLHVGKLKHQIPHLDLVKLGDDGHMPHHAYASDIAETIRTMR